jgi:hypothetical protein
VRTAAQLQAGSDRFNATVVGQARRVKGRVVVDVQPDAGGPIEPVAVPGLTALRVLTEGRRVLVEDGRITEAGARGRADS